MTSIEDVGDELARWSYEQGRDPLDYAEMSVKTHLEVHEIVTVGRLSDPESFAGHHRDLSDEALVRRILGTLLDIGWTDPRSTDDMDFLARWALAHGVKPIQHAENTVRMVIGTHMHVAYVRLADPEAFPVYSPDLSWESLARRILGRLMDAGWTLPDFTRDYPEHCAKEPTQ